MEIQRRESGLVRFTRRVAVVVGAVVLSCACFLVLPLLEAITHAPAPDLTLVPIDTAALPQPPIVEEQEKPPEKPEEKPPDLADEAPPLDLAQLEVALTGGMGGGAGFGSPFALEVRVLGRGGDAADSMFSLKDLDQKPRVINNPAPVLTAALRKKRPATVTLLFVVDQNGKVENPIVQSSSDPAFEAPALAAIKQWKFEPGKRGGQPVRSSMRQMFKFEG